ncbi:hypothetical protein TNCV_2791391 [Trichonephila clavipes]|nr:hypothetical protein TNCV_2791391 [Trichonephila clavipes]
MSSVLGTRTRHVEEMMQAGAKSLRFNDAEVRKRIVLSIGYVKKGSLSVIPHRVWVSLLPPNPPCSSVISTVPKSALLHGLRSLSQFPKVQSPQFGIHRALRTHHRFFPIAEYHTGSLINSLAGEASKRFPQNPVSLRPLLLSLYNSHLSPPNSFFSLVLRPPLSVTAHSISFPLGTDG